MCFTWPSSSIFHRSQIYFTFRRLQIVHLENLLGGERAYESTLLLPPLTLIWVLVGGDFISVGVTSEVVALKMC